MKIIRSPKNGDRLDAIRGMYPSYLLVVAAVAGAEIHKIFRTPGDSVVGSEDATPEEVATSYGYVIRGSAKLTTHHTEATLREGGYFSESGWHRLEVLSSDTVVAVVRRLGFNGQSIIGQIEERGRLSYIDGCSDSMLVAPPRLGDPVFNHLHFPQGIEQTQHTHPSIRLGIVARGKGEAWGPGKQVKRIDVADSSRTTPLTPDEIDASRKGDQLLVPGKPYVKLEQRQSGSAWVAELAPGCIFLLEEQELHSFRTTRAEDTMDVIAFHPDSDWGPTDQNHPMLNRTYIGADVKNHSGTALAGT